jgi:hypothetical protein
MSERNWLIDYLKRRKGEKRDKSIVDYSVSVFSNWKNDLYQRDN